MKPKPIQYANCSDVLPEWDLEPGDVPAATQTPRPAPVPKPEDTDDDWGL